MNSVEALPTLSGSAGRRTMLFSLVIALCTGFACGYGIRELISRRRRAAAREKFFRRQEQIRGQKRYDESNSESGNANQL
jgi:hypothetical protein